MDLLDVINFFSSVRVMARSGQSSEEDIQRIVTQLDPLFIRGLIVHYESGGAHPDDVTNDVINVLHMSHDECVAKLVLYVENNIHDMILQGEENSRPFSTARNRVTPIPETTSHVPEDDVVWKQECCICLHAQTELSHIVQFQCNHETCHSCYGKLSSTRRQQPKCPMCRAAIRHIHHVMKA